MLVLVVACGISIALCGIFHWGKWTLVVGAGSVVAAHGASCSTACRILVPQSGSNPHPLHCKVYSQSLNHQGNPNIKYFSIGLFVSRFYEDYSENKIIYLHILTRQAILKKLLYSLTLLWELIHKSVTCTKSQQLLRKYLITKNQRLNSVGKQANWDILHK